DALLSNFEVFRDYVVVSEKSEALEHFRVHDLHSGEWRDVGLPEKVYAAFLMNTPEYTSSAFRYQYQSMVTPQSVFDCDMATGKQTLLKEQEIPGYVRTRYATERQWAVAKDGARVPLSIVYRKDARKESGAKGLFLYGYGSYGAGMPAGFSSNRLALLDRGMVYVIAHIRGGNELGEAWHDDGMLM